MEPAGGRMRSASSVVIAAMLLAGFAVAGVSAQSGPWSGPTLTDRDRAEIQALSVIYRRALLRCEAEVYADLFATPGGYFASPVRGEVREKSSLMEMVLSYDRCGSPATVVSAGPNGPTPLATPTIEPAPEGARARIPYGAGGGYYDDVYVKTPKGWRFKSRAVVSDTELSLTFTAQDAIEIRQLAGDDHGHYENLYGDENQAISPRGIGVAGRDTRPFRTSGLRLTVQPDGTVKGLAYLRENGGHYEDVYVRTSQGWRITERQYVPPTGTR